MSSIAPDRKSIEQKAAQTLPGKRVSREEIDLTTSLGNPAQLPISRFW